MLAKEEEKRWQTNYAEIVDAFNNQGGAYKRKEDMHRMAEANRLLLTSDFNLKTDR